MLRKKLASSEYGELRVKALRSSLSSSSRSSKYSWNDASSKRSCSRLSRLDGGGICSKVRNLWCLGAFFFPNLLREGAEDGCVV